MRRVDSEICWMRIAHSKAVSSAVMPIKEGRRRLITLQPRAIGASKYSMRFWTMLFA